MNKALVASIFSTVAFGGVLVAQPAFAQIRSEMTIFNDAFISPAFQATQKTSYQFVGAQLKTEEKSTDALVMDVEGAVAIGTPVLNYLNISEFYFAKEMSEDQTLTIGRKKMMWSQVDARWDLGVWEPVFKWNPLSPERQGLIGLFWDVKRKNFAITLFASPLFLPDQGPSYEIQNGDFVKSSPWFPRPPDMIHIFNETTQIEYRMKRPSESQVAFQASYGAKISLGDPQKLFFQVSQIYKPSNQLAIGYDGILNISKDRGVIDLLPQVVYHSMTGADLSYNTGVVKVGVSVLHDRPKQETAFEPQWTHPVYEDALLASGSIDLETRFFAFHFQRIEISGGNVADRGPLADPKRRPLMTRYPFKQANEFGVSAHASFSKFRRITGNLSYTQSDKNDFSMVKMNAGLKLSKLWNIYLEMQLVDAGILTVDNQNEISQYVNNDRLLIGATYVF